MATLNKLIEFTPNDDTERTIYDVCKKDVLNEYLVDTKSTWSKGQFYLGGFIKMKPDDEITLKKINEVKIMRDKSIAENGVCNSAEIQSQHQFFLVVFSNFEIRTKGLLSFISRSETGMHEM